MRFGARAARCRGKGLSTATWRELGQGPSAFLPGALGADVGGLDVLLNVQHDRGRVLARTGGGGLVLTDTPAALEIVATLAETRESSDTLALVEAKILRGFSLEFVALRESMEGPTRVIQSARLVGLSELWTGQRINRPP